MDDGSEELAEKPDEDCASNLGRRRTQVKHLDSTNSMKWCHTITHQIRSRFEQDLLAELLFFGSMILEIFEIEFSLEMYDVYDT